MAAWLAKSSNTEQRWNLLFAKRVLVVLTVPWVQVAMLLQAFLCCTEFQGHVGTISPLHMVTRSRWIPRGGSPGLWADSPRHLDPLQPIDHCYSKKTSFLFTGQYTDHVLEQVSSCLPLALLGREEREQQNTLIPWRACNIYGQCDMSPDTFNSEITVTT